MKKAAILGLSLVLSLMLVGSTYGRSWNSFSVSVAPGIELGQAVTLSVSADLGGEPPAGFQVGYVSLLIYYNPQVLTFVDANMGDHLQACNCGYFNYTVLPCPDSGYNMIKIEALRPANDTSGTAAPCIGKGEFAKLNFVATTDTSFRCKASPVGFYWQGCGDNIFINVDRDTIWYSDNVHALDGNDITGSGHFGGTKNEQCPEWHDIVPYPFMDFYTGGVTFKCPVEFMCGDINGDGKINLLDPVFLVYYFFKNGPAPSPIERGSCDCINGPDLSDLTYIINYIFLFGPPPCC